MGGRRNRLRFGDGGELHLHDFGCWLLLGQHHLLFLRLHRRLLPGTKNLVRRRHPGASVEKSLFLGQRRLSVHPRAVLHWDVNGGAGGPAGGDRLLIPLLAPAALGPAPADRFGLRLVLRAVEDPVGHIHDGAVKGGQSHKHPNDHKDDGGSKSGKQRDAYLSQKTAQDSSRLQRLSAVQQASPQISVPLHRLDQDGVEHTGEDQRQDQGAGQPQLNRASPVEAQDVSPQQQGRRGEQKAVAQQALEQRAEPADKNGLHIKIAQGGENGQQKADHRPYLPADRLLRRRLTALGAAFGPAPAGGAAPPSAGRGAAPPCFLLCCHM